LANRGERETDAILYFGLLALAVLDGQNIKTGPAVGNRVPDFSAQDQEGRRQTLKSVSGPKGTMLVFFRSADS
jgi:hypothetical protein